MRVGVTQPAGGQLDEHLGFPLLVESHRTAALVFIVVAPPCGVSGCTRLLASEGLRRTDMVVRGFLRFCQFIGSPYPRGSGTASKPDWLPAPTTCESALQLTFAALGEPHLSVASSSVKLSAPFSYARSASIFTGCRRRRARWNRM